MKGRLKEMKIKGRVNSTLLPLNRFAGCSFLITFFVEFEIYCERGKLNRTPSTASKMQLRYLNE